MAGKARKGQVTDTVSTWVEDQPPGHEFHYGQLADKLGFNQTSVSTVCQEMLRMPERQALRPGHKSGYFVITGEKTPRRVSQSAVRLQVKDAELEAGSVLEAVGVLKDGSVMLRDGDGRMWKAVRM